MLDRLSTHDVSVLTLSDVRNSQLALALVLEHDFHASAFHTVE